MQGSKNQGRSQTCKGSCLCSSGTKRPAQCKANSIHNRAALVCKEQSRISMIHSKSVNFTVSRKVLTMFQKSQGARKVPVKFQQGSSKTSARFQPGSGRVSRKVPASFQGCKVPGPSLLGVRPHFKETSARHEGLKKQKKPESMLPGSEKQGQGVKKNRGSKKQGGGSKKQGGGSKKKGGGSKKQGGGSKKQGGVKKTRWGVKKTRCPIEDLSLPISQMQRASNIFHDRQSLAHAFSIPALRWLCNGRMMF